MEKDYKKYRWFFTSNGNLVIGGKSSKQNEELVKNASEEDIILHTASPGSPFCIIKNASESDIEEAAVFDACFSQNWKRGRKKSEVHIFSGKNVVKSGRMKEGTFGIIGKVKKINAELKLTLCFQEEKLRAVPIKTAGNKSRLVLSPGKVEKEKAAGKIMSLLKERFDVSISKDEVLSAIPSGSFKIKE